jgi:hypothetical protein
MLPGQSPRGLRGVPVNPTARGGGGTGEILGDVICPDCGGLGWVSGNRRSERAPPLTD